MRVSLTASWLVPVWADVLEIDAVPWRRSFCIFYIVFVAPSGGESVED
jgi:hypothetical protein